MIVSDKTHRVVHNTRVFQYFHIHVYFSISKYGSHLYSSIHIYGNQSVLSVNVPKCECMMHGSC